VWVATRLGLSRSKAKKMLQQGLVTVDGVLETTASRTLQLTNRVEVRKE
jgi:ribosomal protein S4